MLTAVAVVDRTHVRSVDPADYALVHMNVNPEVYDPTLATGDCDDSTEPDVGRLGVAITRWTLSRVSWDRIPHVYFRGTNRSTGAALQIYFSRIDAPAFDEARSFGAAPFPGDGTGFEARFDVLAHPEWRGAITGLRLDPVDGAGCFEVEALELHLPDRPPAWRAPTDTAPAFPSPPWVISGLDPGTIAFRASTPSTAAAWHGCSVGGDPWLALSGLSISAP